MHKHQASAIIKDFQFVLKHLNHIRHQLSSKLWITWKHPFHLHGGKKQNVVQEAPVRQQIHNCDVTRSLNALKQGFKDLTCAINATLHGLRQSLLKSGWRNMHKHSPQNQSGISSFNFSVHVSMRPKNSVARWQRLVWVQVFEFANSGPVQISDRSQMDTWSIPIGCCPKLGGADPTSCWLEKQQSNKTILRPVQTHPRKDSSTCQ